MRSLVAHARRAGLLHFAARLTLPVALLGAAVPAMAQNVSLTGGTYTQNFDTLSNVAGSTTNTALPTGWLLTEGGGGARDNEQYAVDTGSSTTGDVYSYGAAGSTERAFGALRSGTLIPVIGACFTNNTGGTLTSLQVAYTGEQWRLGTAARTDALNFEYSLDATSLTTGSWTGVAALNFVTPDTATTGAKNGNAAATRTALSATIGSLSISNGASFCIRWNDTDASGADDGLAVDDFSLTTAASVSPVLAVSDVSAVEGNSGTTIFIFGIGLSQPAGPGGVSFSFTTADGTAIAEGDYQTGSGMASIPQGATSTTIGIAVNGDTTTEADETFFLNVFGVTGATVADGQGQGTILNDDITVLQIHDIQGSGLTSPVTGASVTTEGIVTAQKFNNGFFLQTPDAQADADPATSQGLFVFTSTAPPASAAVGNRVRVTGTVAEFTPSTNLNQLSITQLTSVTSIQVLSTGNALPAPVVLPAADFSAASTPGTAEKYEGMRVTIASATTVSGSDGNITESSATSSTTGVFHVVLDGVGRPYREAGIGVLDLFPIPGGKTPPRWDTNQERIMVRSRGQVGATSIALDAGAQVTNMTGVMDYFTGTWAVLPDVGSGTTAGGITPTAVPDPAADEVTIAGFNLLRFFDEVNDSNGAPTLQAAALDKRLTKTSLAFCDYLKAPDIVGVVEVENLRVLGMLADRINSTCARAPQYVPYLVQGNDAGGINVGFLVSTRAIGSVSRVEVLEVTQYGKATLFNNPDSSTSLLNDRPPLLLRAIVHADNGGTYPVTVIVNHLRSLNGLDDTGPGSSGWPTEGDRVRNKRAQQALFLANLVHSRQQADPNERIVLLGDFNAFEFSDGYVDVMGIIRGDQVPADQVITHLPSPITAPLIDGGQFIAAPAERYSYVFEGSAQTLDHVVVNEATVLDATDLRVDHARINADFGVHNFGVAGNAIRVSDHDPVLLGITVGAFRSADLSIAASAAPTTVVVGGTVTFTVNVANAGPYDAPSAAVALVFGALVNPAVTAPAGWTCAAPVQSVADTTVTCTTPNFANGGSAVFTATVGTDATLANTTLQLDAAISSQVNDPANANNNAMTSVQVQALSDLAVTAAGGGTVDVGGTANFTVTASNAGPNDAAFTGVALVFDALVTPAVTAPAGWTCAAPSQSAGTTTVTCTLASFANGGSATFSATVPADAALGGTSLGLAAAISSQFTDPNPGNNSAMTSVTVRAIADVATTVATSTPNVVLGGTASWTVGVSNAGPSAAANTTVTLVLNAVVTPNVTAAAGFTCGAPVQTATTTTVTCTNASLASAATGTFAVTVPVTASLGNGTLTLTSTVATATVDTASGNDTASASVNVNTSTDLAATVTATTATALPGGQATWSVGVSNAGPSPANNATVTLTLNALVIPTITAPAGWSCAAPTQTATTTSVVCSNASVASGANGTFGVEVTVPGAYTGTLTLSATVATATADGNAANNTASASVQVSASADLRTQILGRSERGGVFMVVVTNGGPSPAAAPRLTITGNMLPRNVSLVPAAGWSCAPVTVSSGFRFDCTASSPLAVGASAYFGVALAGRGPQTVLFTATVSSTTSDPNTANNTTQRSLTGAGLPDVCVHRYCRR